MAYAPWMDSVTVGASALKLSTLIAAIDPNIPTRFTKLWIQYNVGATGVLLVGRSNLATTHAGANLAPGATPFCIDASDTGVGLTSDVFLLAGAATQQVNIILFPIGM